MKEGSFLVHELTSDAPSTSILWNFDSRLDFSRYANIWKPVDFSISWKVEKRGLGGRQCCAAEEAGWVEGTDSNVEGGFERRAAGSL